MCRCTIVALTACMALAAAVRADDFSPDPLSVQREGPAYRYPQAGWIVLHVEGEPYERGVQQGKLMWREIGDYVKCYAAIQSSQSPADGWKLTRTLADALFIRRFDPELLEEMKGIADGAAAAGAKFDGRPLDLTDIVAINAWPEIMTLDHALHAEPTGLEGKRFDRPGMRLTPAPAAGRCSAFAATGPATRDGKAVIGHITMFDLYPCNFYNVWIDVKPARGHRLVFQTSPGAVQSGMDWYMNDAGIVLTETTIAQTTFNPAGWSIGSRSRCAMQYGDSIDSVVAILGKEGNGLYTNEWLLADMKTNEIALFELGTKTSRLLRSSKDQWFGGTKGFYWGCNNTKDLAVRMETIPAANERPVDMTFVPHDRDMAWVRLYEQYKGRIDGDFGKIAFGKPPLALRDSCDAKYTTAEMALQLKSFAHWGDPYDQLWEPSGETRTRYPAVKPIVPNDWTVLTTTPPTPARSVAAPVAVDLKNEASARHEEPDDDSDKQPPAPVWHGTILPATDGDFWLASAFAIFHDYVAQEHQLLKSHEKNKIGVKDKPANAWDELTQAQRDALAVRLFQARSAVMSDGIAANAVSLRKILSNPSDDAWCHSASGRGVMLLAELRRRVGGDQFDAVMDSFGREHAGKPVHSDAFIAAVSAIDPGSKEFFTHWLDSTDALPTLELKGVSLGHPGADYIVTGKIISIGGFTPATIDVTVETEDSESTTSHPFDNGIARFQTKSDKKPTRVVVNKYGQTPCANGWNWRGTSFERDLDHTLIIYGTRIDAAANRIAAEKLRQGIIDARAHTAVQIKPDSDVGDDDLRGHHLLLIGRPQCSALIARLVMSLPVRFGPRSFVARGQIYGNAESAVIAAGANPYDGARSVVCIAGMSPAATLRAALALPGGAPAPLKVMAAYRKSRDMAPAPPELTWEADSPTSQ